VNATFNKNSPEFKLKNNFEREFGAADINSRE